MVKEVILTDKAPAAIGPYSQAVRAAGFLFISGQIALNPTTGDVTLGDVEKETKQVMENIKAILQAAGASLDSVVKCTIYLLDMADFAVVNEIYGAFFSENPPARATVQVVGLPKGVSVEIDAIAYLVN